MLIIPLGLFNNVLIIPHVMIVSGSITLAIIASYIITRITIRNSNEWGGVVAVLLAAYVSRVGLLIHSLLII